MSGVRLDRVLMTSLFEAFKNYSIPVKTQTITLSGSIPVGGKGWEVRFSYDRAGTIADIYLSKQGSNQKRSINSFWKLLDFVGTSDVQASIYAQYTSTEIIVSIYVTNFGASPYTITTQAYDIEIEAFDGPFLS